MRWSAAALWVVGVAAAVWTACGASTASPNPTGGAVHDADTRWVEYSEGRSFVRVPEGTFGRRDDADGRMSALARCAPLSMGDDSALVELSLRFDADGVHLDALHRDSEVAAGLADCVEETVQTWRIADLPEADALIVPLQFGFIDGAAF